ncbi:MAG: CvpA family protein [Planctomycetota bacterium]|nr:CvpA family protein [Planctomycetota bacterium]
MNWIDISILVLIAVGALLGALSGLLWQIARLVTFCVALYAAIFFHAPVGNWLTERVIENPAAANVLSYVFIFVTTYIVLFLVTWIIEQGLKAAKLKKVDRLLGALLGVVKSLLIAGTVLMVGTYYSLKPLQESLGKSVLAPYLIAGMKTIIVGLPREYSDKAEQFLLNLKSKVQGSGGKSGDSTQGRGDKAGDGTQGDSDSGGK